MIDHAASNPEEGGRDEERQNPGDQRQLLEEVSTVEEVLRRADLTLLIATRELMMGVRNRVR